jgi:hypothetical protein
MLLKNGTYLNDTPGRLRGGTATPTSSNNYGKAGAMRGIAFPEMATAGLPLIARPTGYGAAGYMMPITGGEMSSHYNTDLGFTVDPFQLIPALNAASQIDWSIVINQAALALIVSGVASIPISIDITPAPNLSGSLAAAGSIPFSITVSSFLGAINGAGATLTMSLTADGSTATAKGFISASITSEGEAVTPTSVAAAVWNSVETLFNTAGTMGYLLHAAGSAGDPWTTALPGAYLSGTAGQIIGTLVADINANTDSAVAGIDTTSLKYAIESLRKDHQGFGTVYFWDTINGSDANDGLTPTTAKSTWTAVEALVADGAGDTIYILPDPGTAQVTIDQRLTITKKSLNLRGPGRTIRIKPSSGTGDTITIGAVNVSIQGIVVEGATGDITGSCILVNDKFSRIENCWINRHGYGICVRAGDYHRIEGNEIEYHALSGIHFEDAGFATPGSPREAYIANNTIYFNYKGVTFTGTSSNSTRLNILAANRIHHNEVYGVEIGANTQRTMVQATNYIKDNGTIILDTTGNRSVSAGGAEDPANEIYIDAAASDPMVDNMMDTLPAAFGTYTLEDTQTRDQAMRIIAAVLAGKVSGAGTGTETFVGLDGTTNRVVSTVDSNGNRTAVTVDGS